MGNAKRRKELGIYPEQTLKERKPMTRRTLIDPMDESNITMALAMVMLARARVRSLPSEIMRGEG